MHLPSRKDTEAELQYDIIMSCDQQTHIRSASASPVSSGLMLLADRTLTVPLFLLQVFPVILVSLKVQNAVIRLNTVSK